ncbi:hypothetical protein HPB48_017376 [Haemaphysalis longicornis]|uniref:Uncharacterized protein n=1 Tax=Haemaphysalis longicornis TaxID=44386 RepID=A0A9J6H1C3_HAELO|nr:hypothetical protein HPB48_017376 [Haemaphysalis longicornis]
MYLCSCASLLFVRSQCTIPYKIGRHSEKASSFQHSHGMGRKRKLHANYAKHYPDFEATSSNDLVVCNLCRVQVSTANEIGALGIADPESCNRHIQLKKKLVSRQVSEFIVTVLILDKIISIVKSSPQCDAYERLLC